MDEPPVTPNPETDEHRFALTRYSEYAAHVSAMTIRCGRKINIFSQDFDTEFLDNDQVSDALRTFVVENNRAARVRLLIQRPENAIRQGHKLVELARKLTSFLEIRRPASQHAAIADAYLTFDNNSYLYRELGNRPEGSGCYQNSLRTLELNRKFDEIWAMSEPEPEFRRLGI